MKKNYYYTVNCLPSLSFGEPPPIGKEYFLSLAKHELTATDFTILQSVELATIGDTPALPALTKWYTWEKALRNELVRRRASNLGLDAEEFTRGNEHDDTFSRLIDEVFHVPSPFGAEALLDSARWRFLQDLALNHYFDIERLVIYSLKLQLLTKRALYDKEGGRKTLDNVVSQVEELWNRNTANELEHEN